MINHAKIVVPLVILSLVCSLNAASAQYFGFEGNPEKIRILQNWLGPLTKYVNTESTMADLELLFRSPPIDTSEMNLPEGSAIVSLWNERDAENEITLIISVYPDKDKTRTSDVVWRVLRVQESNSKLVPILLSDEQIQAILNNDRRYSKVTEKIAVENTSIFVMLLICLMGALIIVLRTCPYAHKNHP